VREGFIQFLCRNYPESLPRLRDVSKPAEEEIQQRRKVKASSAVQGKEHKRGPKSPGNYAQPESDGAGS
jgi:hypothetical protein